MARVPRGKQSDLFGGETHVFDEVDWDELPDSEKKKLSRAVIGNNFDDLDEDIQEYVHEHDPESAKIIETIHDFLENVFDPKHVQEYHETGDGADAYIEMFEPDLDSMRDKDLWEAVEKGHEDELDGLLEEGFTREEILRALKNYHNYDVGYISYPGRDAMWFVAFGETEEQADLGYIVELFISEKLRDPFQDEVDRACEGVDVMESHRRTRSGQKERSENCQRLYELFSGKRKYHEVSFHVSLDGGVGAIPDWEKIREDLGAMGTDDDEAVELPEAERIVYRYKDGGFVLNLTPSELKEEGKELGMCVGRKDMPYDRLVRRGAIAIWSVRTQAGRPKFTIEVELDAQGEPVAFKQVKGKGNRVPGFDRDMSERTFKLSEVLLIQELCEAVGLDPAKQGDLRPGLSFVRGLKGNPSSKHVHDKHCSWCARAAMLEKRYGV